PYDVSGWTMPLQMGVEAMAINSPLKGMKLTPVANVTYPQDPIQGEGNYYLIPAAFNRSAIVVNRLLKKGVGVSRYTYSGEDGTAKPGDFLVKAEKMKPGDLETLLKGTGVSVERADLGKPEHSRELKRSRIAIYQTYRASMDEGWTRWVLDHFEFPYTIIHNKDFKGKQFSRKYDVVIFPDINRNLIVKGTFSSRFRGSRAIPPEYKGGIGEKGVNALKKLVKEGGTVVLMDSASELGVSDFKLPYTNVLKGVKSGEFSCPGSILRITVDNRDPVGWGMRKENFIYFSDSPAFRTRIPMRKTIDRKVVAGFKDTGPHLLSGYLKGGQKLNRAVMIMRFRYHKGSVIVLGGRVQNRSQTFGTFKFLFNALYYAGLKK
ncbi:MAG: hypothetical protein GY940_18440, partial [bacterium]|nr:hypothetical protein [bacterium]